jgi:hypothetical protein
MATIEPAAIQHADAVGVAASDLINVVSDLGVYINTGIFQIKNRNSSFTFMEEVEDVYREVLFEADLDPEYWLAYYLLTRDLCVRGQKGLRSLLSEFGMNNVFQWMRDGYTLEHAEMFLRYGMESDLADAISGGMD